MFSFSPQTPQLTDEETEVQKASVTNPERNLGSP